MLGDVVGGAAGEADQDEIVQGRPTAVAQVVDGPADLVGRILRLLADGTASCGTLDGGQTDRAVTAQAGALLWTGPTARVELGGDADTCPDRLSVLVQVAAPPRMLILGPSTSRRPSARPFKP